MNLKRVFTSLPNGVGNVGIVRIDEENKRMTGNHVQSEILEYNVVNLSGNISMGLCAAT